MEDDPRNTPHSHRRPSKAPTNAVASGHSHGPGVFGLGPSPIDRTYPGLPGFILEAPDGIVDSNMTKFNHELGGSRTIEERLTYRGYGKSRSR